MNVHSSTETYNITYSLTSWLLAAAMAFSKIDLKREWWEQWEEEEEEWEEWEEWEEEGSPE